MTGRFLAPDVVPGRPQVPQTWNRYAYVIGSPLTFVDPDGLELQAFFLVTGKVFDPSRHAAIYFRDDAHGEEVDVVFSHGGIVGGVYTLSGYLSKYDSEYNPTTAYRLNLREGGAQALFEAFRAGWVLTASEYLRYRGPQYDEVSNYCAQYVCDNITSTQRWDPVTRTIIEVMEVVDTVTPPHGERVVFTNDALVWLRVLGVLGGAERGLQPPNSVGRNVIIYWSKRPK